MVDAAPLYDHPFHPLCNNKRLDFKGSARPSATRTSRPTRYYIIDFGLSSQYDADHASPQELPVWGGDRTVPEFQNLDEPHDPFPTDIYYLGNLIREVFMNVRPAQRFRSSISCLMLRTGDAELSVPCPLCRGHGQRRPDTAPEDRRCSLALR